MRHPAAWVQLGVTCIALIFVFSISIPISAAPGNATPFVTTPNRCTIAPRTLDDLERILGSATPQPKPGRPVSGDPIDPTSETGRAVIATIEQLFSCLHAGDRLRAYALYTDGYLATILQPGDLPAVGSPYPADDDEQTRIVSIDLHALSEGRVLATVTLDPALIPVQKIFGFILVQIDGEWRVDGVINEIDFSLS